MPLRDFKILNTKGPNCGVLLANSSLQTSNAQNALSLYSLSLCFKIRLVVQLIATAVNCNLSI